ncbi:hypothetical protein EWM64_g1610 [Hericium alpestre]|uniref:Hcy-binding domain-containing protein n=1 Tax=Hericium alpestre TaxID=135208 RepID=A0A4Z0AA39_9AGAM|nr:hypothetical protein EWM64_g1610 [Hericium alpestre]
MVATVAVYFNPAKTIGGMVEADKYCLMGLAFATFLSLGSMNTYWWLEVKPGWEWLADALVILWIGIGMSFVAWMKLWMAKPTFNTACSMTAIILFTVVVKEGGIETLLQVSLIVLVGSVVSNLVCFAIWPQSATIGLQTNMVKTLDSYSTLLKLLTSTFLLEEPIHHPSHEKIQKAVADHQASFTSLKKNLAEARSERLCGGPSGGDAFAGPGRNIGQPYDDAVDSLTRLAQHLNGLRSGTSLQYELAAAHKEGRVTIKKKNFSVGGSEGDARVDTSKGGTSNTNEDTINMLTAAASMFGDLVEELGPPMKSLSATCTDAIKRMREALENLKDPSSTTMQPHDFIEVVSHIERALYAFESTSNHAVLRLYRRSDVSGFTSRASTVSGVDDNMVASGGDNESVFLVYFFIFTLQEFANELVSLVDAMGRIYLMERARVERERWFTRVPKQLFSCLRARNKSQERPLARARKSSRMGLQRLSSYIKPDDRFHIASSFPKVRPHAPNTIQTPAWSSRSFTGKISWILWTIGGRMRERDFKYAVKAGMATAMLAAPAFFDATRPIFMEYRGEWALISFFVVMSPTIGATNFLGVNRVLGTLFGALTATAIYSAFPENAVVLSLFGFFYSIPCFYYIVAKPQYATTGRFVLLTYNLSCLYCYNVRRKDVSVTSIAFHRFTAVTVGVVWAAIVSRFWWPAEARRELSKALGEFCLNIGWLYTRLAAANAGSDDLLDVVDESESPSELTSLIPRRRNTQLNNSIEQFMAMEFHLQVKLIELQDLLKQTQHEPRLKGPFPIKLYRSILTSLQSTLDKLHSMRSVTTRAEWSVLYYPFFIISLTLEFRYTDVRRDFIVPVNRERREMVGNIILYFSVLASAFRLKAPLPPYLPPAEKARQQLVNAIRKLDVVKNRDIKGSRQLLFFAYALTMRGITQELDFLGRTSQDAFGVIGQSVESFEEMFRDEEYEARVRRDALKRLIELSRSPYTSLKKISAGNITKFFKDFPDLDEDAINAVYDLCEDQDSKVRIDGYKAIVQMSKEQPKWVKRNADVLVQLLQSDEPDEVTVVKKALTEHLDMDSKVTLGVLCDQIVSVDEAMDDEDREIRERLRSLVLAFMSLEAKRAIITRHANQPGNEQEQVLVNGLFKALERPGSQDAHKIVKDILLFLPSFRGRSSRGDELLQLLLDQAQISVKEDLVADNEPVALERGRYYLELAMLIAVERGIADPIHLLRFYCTTFLENALLRKLSREVQLFVFIHLAETLSACSSRVSSETDLQDVVSCRRQIVDASTFLFPQLVAQSRSSDTRYWTACRTVLSAYQQRAKESDWSLPSQLVPTLEALANLANEQQVREAKTVQDLIRSLLHPPVPSPPPRTASLTQKPPIQPISRPSSTIGKRKAKPETKPVRSATPSGQLSIRGQQARELAQQAVAKQAGLPTRPRVPPVFPSPRQAVVEVPVAKRIRTGGSFEGDRPSLLERLGANGNGNGARLMAAQRQDAKQKQPASVASEAPVVGLSIKGAARAAATTGRRIVFLDGGLGTTLEDVFKKDVTHPLWSAKPIDEEPEVIIAAHLAFLRAGARIISTSTYQCAFNTFARAGYSVDDAATIMRKAVDLAVEACVIFLKECPDLTKDDIKIALSLGPYGATLQPTQEFDGIYPPPYGPQGFSQEGPNRNAFTEEEAQKEAIAIDALTDFHLQRLRVFANEVEIWSAIDCVAFETVPLRREMEAIKVAMRLLDHEMAYRPQGFDWKPWWISAVFPSGRSPQEECPGGGKLGIRQVWTTLLREETGDTSNAVERSVVPDGIGINCTGLEYLADLLREGEQTVADVLDDRPKPWLVVYPNGGETYDKASRTWQQSADPSLRSGSWAEAFASIVRESREGDFWPGLIVGGCCKVGPDEIEALVAALSHGDGA